MNPEPQTGRLEFLLTQIEDQIKAGFAFVAGTRKACKSQTPPGAELQNALAAKQTAELPLGATARSKVHALTQQVIELREAIVWVQDVYVSSGTKPQP